MFARPAPSVMDDDRKDIFAPVADLMVGVIFVFLILILSLFLSLQQQGQVPRSRYDEVADELQRSRDEVRELKDRLDRLAAAHAAQTAHMERVMARQNRLEHFVAFVRDELATSMQRMSAPDTTRDAILTEMERRLRALHVEVRVNREAGTISLPSGGLFLSGDARPTEAGRTNIRALAQVMAEVLPCSTAGGRNGPGCPATTGHDRSLGAVFVEGHTDAVPYPQPTERFQDNWDLSAARGLAAFKLIAVTGGLSQLIDPTGQKLLGVSGYGDTHPADPNVADRADKVVKDNDRRIAIRLMMSAEAGQIGTLLDRLEHERQAIDEISH